MDLESEENLKLIQERDISFKEIIAAIANNGVVDIVEHQNQKEYKDKKIYVICANEYIYLVPFVEGDDGCIFLKTIIPSRKAKQKYLGRRKDGSK